MSEELLHFYGKKITKNRLILFLGEPVRDLRVMFIRSELKYKEMLKSELEKAEDEKKKINERLKEISRRIRDLL
ncbi:MAG: DUF5320 domain-containing protein [Gammaproteobacteria bacterium]|nr:DUF5320 domain-containing protein [Gammaproteobacteria bacterium]